jgi:predicted permease
MSWRTLRRAPAFTLTAVLLLAIGIGGTTVVFSVIDALLLRRLAVARPGELARVVELIPGRPSALYLQWDEFEEFRSRTRSFTALVAHTDFELTMEQGTATRTLRGALLSPNYFDVVGVRPALGHLPAHDNELLLSHQFWQAEFHGDPAIAGRVLRVNRQSFTIAGVLPRGFNGVSVESGPQVHLLADAARLVAKSRDLHTCCQWEVAGRLRPGVTLEMASRESADTMHAALIAAGSRTKPLSDEDRGYIERERFHVEPLEHGVSRLRDRFGPGLLALFGGAVLLLLLACANVAGMMVARAASREREMALRAALGATRTRLVRLWLAESSMVAILGGVAGLALAAATLPVVSGRMPPLRDLATYLVPVALDLRLDWRVFAFAFGLCALAALLAGIAPAWHSTRVALNESLKATAGDPRRARLRSILTIVQVAICTVVLANSALLIATLRALRAAPVGFDRDRVITFNVDKPSSPDLALRLEREARALPGVDDAALASRSLMRGSGMKSSVGLPGKRTGRELNTSLNSVSPDYFNTMGVHILQGRSFVPADGARDRKPGPVVVNQAFVRRFLPGADPIGRTFGTGLDRMAAPDFEIVGVVSDTRYRSLREPFLPIVYFCFCGAAAREQGGFSLEIRTTARPETVIAAVRAIDPTVPYREIRTLAQDVDDSLWAERTLAAIGSAFAGVAALVAAIGLYGLLSYTLAQRRREIGIRIALGAGHGQIARAVLVRVLVLVTIGAAAGTAIALWTGRLLSDVLWEVRPVDPRIHIAAWLVLFTAAIAAAALPAWRATRVDPAKALREN